MDHYEFFGGLRCGYILNLSTKFELDWSTDRQESLAQTHRHTHTETDTLRSSKKGGKDKWNYPLHSVAFSLSVSFSTCLSCSIFSSFTIYFFLLLPFCSLSFSLSLALSPSLSLFLSPLYEQQIKCVS